MRDILVHEQATQGVPRGSWDPRQAGATYLGPQRRSDFHDQYLSALTLEVYYRYLPLYKLIDKPGEEGAH